MNNDPKPPPKYKYPGTIMENEVYPPKIKPPTEEITEKEARMALEKRIAALEKALNHLAESTGIEPPPTDGEKQT
jgi:hypothetical protein